MISKLSPIIYGYARVSTLEQNLDLQIDALKKAGCKKILQEKVSSVKERPQLEKLFSILNEGDTLIIWKLDRLGRSLKHLIQMVDALQEQNVKFISLQDNINTQTAQGRFIFNLFASLAEFEREMIRERTNAGLSAARARGRLGGRPKGLSNIALLKARSAKELYYAKQLSIIQICNKLTISRRTLYKYIKMDVK